MNYQCPSCADILEGLKQLHEHWKKEGYDPEGEYGNFDQYVVQARYEYLYQQYLEYGKQPRAILHRDLPLRSRFRRGSSCGTSPPPSSPDEA